MGGEFSCRWISKRAALTTDYLKGDPTCMTDFQYLEDVDAILGIVEGELSYQKYKDSVADLMKFPPYKPGMSVIWDLRRTTSKSLSSQDVQSVASYSKTLDNTRGNWKAALVIPSLLEYGLGRMFQAWLEDAPFALHVCYTIEEAKAWLKAKDT